jgi:hypothetical protein
MQVFASPTHMKCIDPEFVALDGFTAPATVCQLQSDYFMKASEVSLRTNFTRYSL